MYVYKIWCIDENVHVYDRMYRDQKPQILVLHNFKKSDETAWKSKIEKRAQKEGREFEFDGKKLVYM